MFRSNSRTVTLAFPSRPSRLSNFRESSFRILRNFGILGTAPWALDCLAKFQMGAEDEAGLTALAVAFRFRAPAARVQKGEEGPGHSGAFGGP